MSNPESTTNVTTQTISQSTELTTEVTTTAPDQSPGWFWILVITGVAILVFVVIVLILFVDWVFRYIRGKYILPRGDYQNFSDRPFERRGLRNLGNTCYFNSTIQCLASTTILKSQVDHAETAREKEITKAFNEFLAPIDSENGSASSSLDPKPLLTAFCAKVARFRGAQQRDSHELLRQFLDQLRQEERVSWKDVNPNKKLTAVDKVFGGHFMTVYICENCKTPSHICEPFLDISVPICVGDLTRSETLAARQTEESETESLSPYQMAIRSIMVRLTAGPVDLPTEILSITDCLQHFTRQETLGQQYLCNNCAVDSSSTSQDQECDTKLSPATKQTLILNPPAVLVIHLKRFEMKKPKFEKRSNMIKFDEILDLAPYCSSCCQRNKDQEKNIWYSLYGVVVHSGTLTSGHYVAYVKERNRNEDLERFLQNEYFDRDVTEDQLVEMMQIYKRPSKAAISSKGEVPQGIWYLMNDSRVSKVNADEVLRQEAFLLFYERVSPIVGVD